MNIYQQYKLYRALGKFNLIPTVEESPYRISYILRDRGLNITCTEYAMPGQVSHESPRYEMKTASTGEYDNIPVCYQNNDRLAKFAFFKLMNMYQKATRTK